MNHYYNMNPKPNYPCESAGSLHIGSQVNVNASGFKVPLLFGGSSKDGIGGIPPGPELIPAPILDWHQARMRGSWMN